MCRGVFFAAQKEPWCDLLPPNTGVRQSAHNRGSLNVQAAPENPPLSPHVVVELAATDSSKDGSPPPSYSLYSNEKSWPVPQVPTKTHNLEGKFKRLSLLLLILLFISIITNALATIRIWQMRTRSPSMITAVQVRAKEPVKIVRHGAHKAPRRMPPHRRCKIRPC